MPDSLHREALALLPELVAIRRDLHRHPELAFQEHRTAAVAAKAMSDLGFSVRTEVGKTGVVAELVNGGGPIVAIRADMDALPVTETNTHDFVSTISGLMHACGHDAHVAGLIGAARLLAARSANGTLPGGTVRFLFQPSEEASDSENKSGAVRMIEDGAMDGVAAVFGVHVGGHVPRGVIAIAAGAVMAGTDRFKTTVLGKSAHVARPHEAIDALVIAAHLITAAQLGASRSIEPGERGVLGIGTIMGGTAENIVAGRVEMQGTIRYFTETTRERLHDALGRALNVGRALGADVQHDLSIGYPPLVNDSRATEIARAALAAELGSMQIVPQPPIMAAEDFAILARHAPGCFIWVGAAPTDRAREHHAPDFDIDEQAIADSAAVLASVAIGALNAFA